MPPPAARDLERILADGPRGGVFFLHGDEEFLRDEAERRIVDAHLDPATRDFNLDVIRGGEADSEALASVIQTPPMMAEWRVVVVRDAQALAGSSRLRAVIDEVLERTPPGLALILSARIPDRSKARFWTRLKREAAAAEFPALDASDLPGWLMARAEREGVRVDPDALRALVAAVGTELSILLREMEKLREFVGEGGTIDRAAVAAAVGVVVRQDRWAWFDLVGEGRIAEARRTLPVLLDGSESGVGLVIGLGAQFLRLALAAAGGEASLSAALPPHQRWLMRRLLGQARRWSAAALEAALDDLLRADRLLKSTSLGELPIMDELLLRLQARRAVAA